MLAALRGRVNWAVRNEQFCVIIDRFPGLQK